jgi:hypothetical protein
MLGISSGQDRLPFRSQLLSQAIVNGGRRHQPESGVAMLVVVPGKEGMGPGSRIGQTTKTVRVIRAVLHRFELSLGVGIIIGDVRTGVALAYAQVRQEKGERFAGHRTPPVSVQNQLVRGDALFGTTVGHQLFGQRSQFSVGYHVTYRVATEEVQDGVEIIGDVCHRPAQLGNVPRPDLVGCGGHQLRLGVGRMPFLVPPFAHFIVITQDALHGTHRAKIDFFIKQRAINLSRRAVHKPVTVERLPHAFSLRGR